MNTISVLFLASAAVAAPSLAAAHGSAASAVPARRALLEDALKGDYERVTPMLKQAGKRRALRSAATTEPTDVLVPDFSYSVSGFGKDFNLELVHDVKTFSSAAKHYLFDGERFVEDKDAAQVFHAPSQGGGCLFRGSVNGEESSRVRMSTCRGYLEGTFRVDGVDYFLQAVGDDESEHVLYRNDHIIDDGGHCGNDDHHDHDHDHHDHDDSSHSRRLSGAKTLPNQSTTKYVKLLLVNDHARYQMKGSVTHAHTAILASMVSGLYEDFPDGHFDVEVQVIGVLTFSSGDPWDAIETNSKGEISHSTLLNRFNEWRVQALEAGDIPEHSSAHLLSGQDFTGGVVGLAGLGSICNTNSASGVTQATSTSDIVVGSVLAHELGHNLGLYHTSSSNSKTPIDAAAASACSAENGGHSIMSPNGAGATKWSSCDPTWLRVNFDGYPFGCAMSGGCSYARYYGYYRSYPMCLEGSASSADVWRSDVAVCGDGIREGDEQCDCGGDDCSEVDPCCDGRTCKFTAGSECSAKDSCCDGATCKIWKPNPLVAGGNRKVCRGSSGGCDREEVCDGVSASCPADSHAPTGQACVSDETGHDGICYGGQCESHEAQCKAVKDFGWSSLTGSCSYKNHDDGDAACKALFCASGSSGGCSYNYNVGDGTIMVRDGTSCGAGRACFNEKCMAISELPGSSSAPAATDSPTKAPTTTKSPTKAPTVKATKSPTKAPTVKATKSPTHATKSPTVKATKSPTRAATSPPTCKCCTGTFWQKLWCRLSGN